MIALAYPSVSGGTARLFARGQPVFGGQTPRDPFSQATDEAQRPLAEAGEGEAEGFELAEQELEDHATHSDQHAARRVLEDASGGSGD